MYQVGQGILGRIKFRDGEMPQYDRPYLIVQVNNNSIGVLNVSSVKGKEDKAIFNTNYVISNFNPPFIKPSFVKLDSLTIVTESFIDNNCTLLKGGALLHPLEINSILSKLT